MKKMWYLMEYSVQFSSVQSLSRVRFFATPWIAAHQASHPSPTPGVYSNSCPSSQWCHPAISSSVVPISSCPQSFPASGSFPMSQLFTQSIGISASASVLPMNTQHWSPLGWTGWIYLLNHKKEWNFAICSNIGGLGGYYAKWDKSEKDKYCMISHVESKK